MDILQLAVSNVPITQSATYSCVLTNNWSGMRHPIDYASVTNVAHWSPPVLLAHNDFVDLWSPGDFASPGIEDVAELGSTPALRDEIEILQTKGLAGQMVIGADQFNARDPPQTLDPITLSPKYPSLSTISMIAPSPDWFSGIDSFSPRGPGGYWYQSFEIATYPFDAGTEQGTTYTINNDEEPIHGPIYQLTRDTVPASGILLDPTGTTVLPVATWTCTLTNGSVMTGSPGGLRGDSSGSSMMSKPNTDSSMMSNTNMDTSASVTSSNPNSIIPGSPPDARYCPEGSVAESGSGCNTGGYEYMQCSYPGKVCSCYAVQPLFACVAQNP